jgi:hypothetical protein
MHFTPTTAQLELLTELQTARMPRDVIAARRLGVDLDTFRAWTARFYAKCFRATPNARISREWSPIGCFEGVDGTEKHLGRGFGRLPPRV